MKMKYLTIAILAISIGRVFAQDPHLSQYDASQIILNPSLTGMYEDGEFRAASQYRSQWGSLASKFNTAAFSVDLPYDNRLGFGGYLINNDIAKVFNVINFVASGAYQITTPNNNRHKLLVGLQAGIIYKSIKDSRLIFDNQYSNGNFDPDLPNGETFDRKNKLMPDFNYGIYYGYIDPVIKYHPYLGISIFHITSPKETFFNMDDSRLPRRYLAHAGVRINISENFVLDPKGLFMMQSNAKEINVGLKGYYTINNTDYTIIGGGYYRLNDAAVMMLGLSYQNFIYQISYDMTVSNLKKYNYGIGGLEFSLVFVNGDKKRKSTSLFQ